MSPRGRRTWHGTCFPPGQEVGTMLTTATAIPVVASETTLAALLDPTAVVAAGAVLVGLGVLLVALAADRRGRRARYGRTIVTRPAGGKLRSAA